MTFAERVTRREAVRARPRPEAAVSLEAVTAVFLGAVLAVGVGLEVGELTR